MVVQKSAQAVRCQRLSAMQYMMSSFPVEVRGLGFRISKITSMQKRKKQEVGPALMGLQACGLFAVLSINHLRKCLLSTRIGGWKDLYWEEYLQLVLMPKIHVPRHFESWFPACTVVICTKANKICHYNPMLANQQREYGLFM